MDSGNTSRPIPTGKVGPAASSATLPTEHFQYRGRRWRIFKRSSAAAASWHLYFEADKRRHLLSLGTSSKQHAISEAKLKLDLHFAGREEALRASMVRPGAGEQFTPLAKLLARVEGRYTVVDGLAIDAQPYVRHAYVKSLLWVLQRATQADPMKLTAGVLTRETGRKYFAWARAEAAGIASQADANTFKRTCNQMFTQAMSLFSPRAVESMREDFQLAIPRTVSEFREAFKLHSFEVQHGGEFQIPGDDIIRKTLVEFVKLGRVQGYTMRGGGHDHAKFEDLKPEPLSDLDRRNMFVMIGLALSCGLRVGEIERAEWRWFQSEEHSPLLKSYDTNVKNLSGQILVVPVDPFWRILNFWIDRNGWRTGQQCLAARPLAYQQAGGLRWRSGGAADRTFWPAVHVSHWLRALGWQTQKAAHALRDYTASQITMKFGREDARQWARHSDQRTTARHYNRFVNPHRTAHREKKLAWLTWAT